ETLLVFQFSEHFLYPPGGPFFLYLSIHARCVPNSDEKHLSCLESFISLLIISSGGTLFYQSQNTISQILRSV
ncbi:MAG: hypothetical protein PHR32_09525, partial [Candidatus Cloacimonetes bacterium]|nr:hypothetical protein [Candidatus Cloacimonadota bacterium]